jgi:hypothetical protein
MTEPETVPSQGRLASEDEPVLAGELAGRLDTIEGQITEFHRRSAHRESVIDVLLRPGADRRRSRGTGRLHHLP